MYPALLSRRGLLAGGASALMLSACNVVPRGAPSRREVVEGAHAADSQFFLEVVSRDRLPLYAYWREGANGPEQTGWLAGGGAPEEQRIAPGDRLEVRVWDPEDSSLLTSPGAQFADLVNLTVSSRGHVNVPYVGPVAVAGLSMEAARQRLETSLTAIIPSAQVQLQITQGRRNSVDMVGGVARPGSYPLTERNMPLTSLISLAGGVVPNLRNPQVQITRGGQVYRRPLAFVLEHPRNDPALVGGDRILIMADTRSFIALGAAGREEIIPFDAQNVTALRAISLMGGMNDTRADPRGLLVLRRHPERVTALEGGPGNARVVFSFDLTNATGLFLADEFLLADGDVVMATQAPATTVQRVLSLGGTLLAFQHRINNL